MSNVALGVFSVLALRAADRRYSELIDRSVPVLNDLQTLTAQAAQAMVATNPVRLEAMGPAEFMRAATAAIAADASQRTDLLHESWLTKDGPDRKEMAAAGQAFTATAAATVSLIEKGSSAEVAHVRETRLRPAFDRYIIAITKTADVLESESRKANLSESNHTSSISTLLIGFATWPVVAIIALVAVTAAFVLVLMLLFRGRELSDAP